MKQSPSLETRIVHLAREVLPKEPGYIITKNWSQEKLEEVITILSGDKFYVEFGQQAYTDDAIRSALDTLKNQTSKFRIPDHLVAGWMRYGVEEDVPLGTNLLFNSRSKA